MTGDELAAALYAEQGYLVIGSATHTFSIGEIAAHVETPKKGNMEKLNTPLRVVAVSNRDELSQQWETAKRLIGIKAGPLAKNYISYYRVEAAD